MVNSDMSRNLLPTIARQKSYQPVNWTSRHRNCVHLEMAGYKNKEIAQILEWTPSKVSITLQDDRAELERISMAGMVAEKLTDVHVKLNLLSHEAVQETADLMRHSENDGIRLKAAFGILDRAGYSTVHKMATVDPESVPVEMFESIKEVMDELNQHSHKYATPAPEILEEVEEAEFEVVT